MYESLVNKRVVVTAAAQGIGRAMAEAFLAAGARVHVCDLEAARLDAFRNTAPALGTTVADVAAPPEVARLFAEAEDRLGGLDVLINNAGIAGPAGPVEDCAIEDWRRTIAVGLDGAFHCLRHAVPLLKATGAGSIINISSTAGLMGYPLRAPYTAAKWALVGLTKSLAVELGPFGIRVNAICPGSVDGPRMERVIAAEAKARGLAAEQVRERYLRNVSLRTFIDGGDIADMALFLASDAGAKISGQALAVDGHTESLAN
jgi:NAD(P)-dependent dehydrogenase (short-subunit alcohol dehydrogenase family)